jgi:hypothetical protein
MKQSQFLESFKQFEEGLEKLYWKKNPDWYLQFKRFDDEEFKEIKGYYGLYFISNYGQVVNFRKKFPQLLKHRLNTRLPSVKLRLHKGYRTLYIHNLVYKTFVGPIRSNRKVIHKNGVITDNYYKNLKVVMLPAHLRKLVPLRKNTAVLQFEKEGRYLKQYPCIEAAAAAVGISDKMLRLCLSKKYKTAGGYQWRYRDDKAFSKWITDIEPVKYRTPAKSKPVLQFDLKGNFFWEYPSIKAAAKDLGYSADYLSRALARKSITKKEFQWRFKDDPLFKNGIVNIKQVEFTPPIWGKAVLQFDLKGEFIEEFPNIITAASELDIDARQISKCINGKLKKAAGFQWKLKNDPLFSKRIVNIGPVYYDRIKQVLQFTKEGKFIRNYSTMSEAAKAVGVSRSTINGCILGKVKTAGGFQWRAANIKVEQHKKINDIKPVKYKSLYRGCAVLQFDLKGNFIREYRNTTEAERKTNIHCTSINACATRKYKSAGNFQWRFRNDPLFKDGIVNIGPLPPLITARSRAVLQFDLEGNFIKEYPSISAARREIGGKEIGVIAANIGGCTLGKRKTAAGFQWKSKNDPRLANGIDKIEPATFPDLHKSEPILQFNLEGKLVKKYDSASQAAGELNGFAYRIRMCCRQKYRTYKGFQFRYQKDLQQPGNKEEKKPSIEPFKGKIPRKYPPIFQFSRDGKFIAKYSSAREASGKLGINTMNIRLCLAGKGKTSGGFQWRPSDDPLFKNGITDIPPVR